MQEIAQHALAHYIDLLERLTTLDELYGFVKTRILVKRSWNAVEPDQQDEITKMLEIHYQAKQRDALVSFAYECLDAHEVLTWFDRMHTAKKLEGTDTPWRVFGTSV